MPLLNPGMVNMASPLRFGTLGVARITTGGLTGPAADNPDALVAAVAARDRSRAESFAKEHGIETVYDTYDDVIRDPTLDVIYNPLPISHHHEYTIKALRAGKHVLCEKAFALNATEAEEMAATARETGLVLIEGFHYRYHPVFLRALEIFDSGVLGAIQRIDGRFGISTPQPSDIRMNYETGGGATMDIGAYPISWLRHITRQEPEVVSAEARIGNPDVDLWLKAEYRLADGAVATTMGSMIEKSYVADLDIRGTRGRLLVVNPLLPHISHSIELTVDGKTTYETLTHRPTYAYQLDAFIDAVRNGTPLPTDAEDAVKQMRVIDAAYRAAGMRTR